MTAQPEIVRQSDLINQLVLDRQTLEEFGRLETLWMYPPAHRVLGFICKAGFLGGKKFAFKLSQLAAVGASGVLTHSRPEPTEPSKVQQLESLLQHELWSDEGNQIGKITDCLFNLQTGVITDYLFVSNGWAGAISEVYRLLPADITSFGKKRVLVAESSIDRFSVYQEGISQKLTKAKDVLQQEAAEELRSLSDRAESVAEQAKARLQKLSQQAREKAQVLSEQLNEQFQEVKEETRIVAEQVKARSQVLGRQVEEGIQTLTVQAEEMFDSAKEPEQNRTDQDWEEDWEELEEPVPPVPKADDRPTPSVKPAASLAEDDDEPWI